MCVKCYIDDAVNQRDWDKVIELAQGQLDEGSGDEDGSEGDNPLGADVDQDDDGDDEAAESSESSRVSSKS